MLQNKSRAVRIRLYGFLILAGLLVLLAVLAPLFTPNDPNATSAADMNAAPSARFPFGTDRYGRCVCSRVLVGARTSIFSAVALVAITFVVGALLGMLAGWYGGVVDSLVMRVADVLNRHFAHFCPAESRFCTRNRLLYKKPGTIR